MTNLLHYFDLIIMEGPPADTYTWFFDTDDGNRAGHNMGTYLYDDGELLLHVRSIGLSEFVFFTSKAGGVCDHHRGLCADELGLDHLSDREYVERLSRELAKANGVKIRRNGDRWEASFTHPSLRGVSPAYYRQKAPPMPAQIIADTIEQRLQAMVMDVVISKNLGIPLAGTTQGKIFEDGRKTPPAHQDLVCAQVRLPFIEGLTTGQLISLRHKDSPAFGRFQQGLLDAVRAVADGTAETAGVARAVERDLVARTHQDIADRLAVHGRSLGWKIGAGLAVGSALAILGAVADMPLVLTAGIGAAATPLTQVYKYFDDRATVRLSDLYFLWKARNTRRHG